MLFAFRKQHRQTIIYKKIFMEERMEREEQKRPYASPCATVYKCGADVITSSVGTKYLSDWGVMDGDAVTTLNQTAGE